MQEGRLREALGLFRQAESLAVREGDRWTTGMVLANIGLALHGLGQWREAEEAHKRSFAIAREIGSEIGIGSQLHNLGQLRLDQGDLGQAAERARTLVPDGDLELRRSIDSSLAGIDDLARLAAAAT